MRRQTRSLYMRHAQEIGAVIVLTTLKGENFILNADQIQRVVDRGDVMVICNNGMRLRVRETFESIVEQVIAYQQKKHMMPIIREEEG